jgi:peroxiredoxin
MNAQMPRSAIVQELATKIGDSVAGSRLLAAVIVLLAASVTLNVILARRVRSFAQFQSVKVSGRLLQAGATVPAIMGKRLDGEQEAISYQETSRPTVLYIFTPPCSWCARNMDNFKTLMEKEAGQYRFVGVSLAEQGLPEYIAKNNLKLPVYSGLSPETLKAYKLGSTPQTIVISPEGKVLQDWVGAYVGDQKSQVEAFFHVRLPGLRSGS